MKKSLISVLTGFVFIVALALDAGAQMSGCMGQSGGMQGGGMMMGGMGQRGMGQMHGAGGMQGEGMMMDDDHPMWRHLMGLGLDEKQKDALKAIKSKAMKDAVRKRADKKIARIELDDLLDKDTVDMKAVETLAKKIEGLRTEMFLAHIKVKEEIKALLTPAQRKQLREMMAPGHGMGGMMGGMGRGMMHGGGQTGDRPAEKKEHMMH